jgi:V8-like Glu-specific endopeptidase
VICTWRGESGGRPRSLEAAVAIVVAGVAAALGFAPASATADAAPTAVAKAVHRDADAVREYWTPRRMRAAEPAGLRLGASGRVTGAPLGTPSASAKPARVPASRAAVDASAASTRFPERVHGKVFLTISGGSQPGDYVCSATVVASNAHTLAWTAGHCVHDPEFGGGFASNWAFVPAFRNGERPFGTWPARELFTTRGWSQDINIRQDIGAARLARDQQGRGIEDVLGARGIAFNGSRTHGITAFGYPALTNPLSFPPRFDFDGQRLWSCASPITASDSPPGAGPATMQIECDMTGGASGGGWVTGTGRVNGVTSYGYVGDGSHLYGPYFGEAAERLYDDAAGKRTVCAKREVTNLGGSGKDDFDGSATDDVFKLKGAADRIAGAGGDDAACGGGGRDRLAGERGNDTLRGGRGRDLLIGGPGRDTCDGGRGRDRARGCERERRIP